MGMGFPWDGTARIAFSMGPTGQQYSNIYCNWIYHYQKQLISRKLKICWITSVTRNMSARMIMNCELFWTRPGATGGIPGLCPPNDCLCPPKRKLCPEEINRLLESKSRPKLVFFEDWQRISWRLWDEDLFFLDITCFRPEKMLEFAISGGKSFAISVNTFFLFCFVFWISPVFGRKKCLNLRFRAENPLQFQWRPFFFFGDHLFSAGKSAWICDFGRKILCNFSEDLFFWRSPVYGRKIPLNLCFSPCSLDPDWDKFLVFPCPSRIHTK